MRDDPRHIPVLLTTVLQELQPKPGDTVVDCTLGLGGHAYRFLEAIGPTGHLYGIDADARNLKDASERLRDFGTAFHPVPGNFGSIAELGLPIADIVLADLGLSSPHIDEADRGFSFRFHGPLDLRFDRTSGVPVSELLKTADEHTLVYVFRTYGELKDVRRLIGFLRSTPPETTEDLTALVKEAFDWKAPKVLPQIFQALRIWVNDEIGVLERLLAVLPSILKRGGRAGFISYHSLEDRLVKHALRALVTPEKDPVTGRAVSAPEWELPHPKGIQPTQEDIVQNPRARSARLRIIHRLP